MAENNPFSEQVEALANQCPGLGVLVLSSSRKLLFLNQRASDLCRQMSQADANTEKRPLAQGVLPTRLTTLALDILNHVEERTEAKEWEHFEVTRRVGDALQPIILRGFGLPDQRGVEHARVVITLEEVGRRQDRGLEQAKERFQPTEREQAVVEQLVKGVTNKQIAAALGITEQTVKAHIQQMMQKTQSNTRTELLMKVLST